MTKRKKINERVNCSAIEQIANHSNFEIINVAEFFLDGVQIKECLSRMFSIAISCIDNWNGRNFCSPFGGSGFVVAQDNYIGVPRDNPYAILQRFSFDGRRKVSCAFSSNYLSAELEHSGFERKPSAGTRFIENTGENFILQKFWNFALAVCSFELICFSENIYKYLFIQKLLRA